MNTDNKAIMSFTERIEFKALELFKCSFFGVDEDTVRAQVAYRFALANYHYTQAQERLEDVANVIKAKNPSLL